MSENLKEQSTWNTQAYPITGHYTIQAMQTSLAKSQVSEIKMVIPICFEH